MTDRTLGKCRALLLRPELTDNSLNIFKIEYRNTDIAGKQNAFIRAITGDLNDYLFLAFGYTGTDTANKPITGNGYVEVLPNSNYSLILQRFTVYNSTAQYERWYLSGAWGEWVKVR